MSSVRHPLQRLPREFDPSATMADVRAGYRLFLKREPDAEGYRHHQGLVAQGMSLELLIHSFVNSDEYLSRQRAEAEVVLVDLGGYSVCVARGEKDFGKSLIETGEYEPHVRQALAELLKPGQTMVDIGANVGCIAFHAAKLVGPTGTVIAVEPFPPNVQLLYAGIAQNGFTNIQVLPNAALDERRIVSLTGGTSNAYVVEARPVGGANAYAQSVVLDEALDHLPAIHLVKMDIEGFEPFALQGCQKLLDRHRPILLTEFNPRCLRDVTHYQPQDYLDTIFGRYPRVRVLTAFGDDVTFTSTAEVMAHWRNRNQDMVNEGLLPDYMLHFDLVAYPD